MPATTRPTSLREPPSGVTANFTTRPGRERPQVSRRGTCKCVTSGSGLRGRQGRALPVSWRGGRDGGGRSSSAGPGPDGQGCRFDGSGALEPVEASGDGGDLRPGVPGPGELSHVGVEEAFVRPSGPLGEPLEVVGCQAGRSEVHVEGAALLVPGARPWRTTRSRKFMSRLFAPAPAPRPNVRPSSLCGRSWPAPVRSTAWACAAARACARPDDRAPALLEVGIGQVDPRPS